MIQYYVYIIGQFLVNHLPLKVSYGFATFLSDMHYFLSATDRRSVTNNLKVIMNADEKTVKPLVREVFRNFGRYLMEFFRMNNDVNDDFFKNNVEVVHLERLQKGIKHGRGTIFITAHIGNWEIGGVAMCHLSHPFVAIALPHKERSVNELFNKKRLDKGIEIVQTNQAIRRCLEALKENRIVGLLADRDFNANGEVLDFLGKKAIIPKGAAIFSARTGAPIVPLFFVREKEGHFKLFFEEPIFPPRQSEGEVDRETLLPIMRQYAAVIETYIRRYPTQWLMFREFWVKD